MKRPGDGSGFVVVNRSLDRDIRMGVALEDCADEGIVDSHAARHSEEDIAPDPSVAAANGRNPIPADGCVERWVVKAENAAVLGCDRKSLLFNAARSRVFDDAYCECILRSEFARYVELGSGESAVDSAKFLAVQIDLGSPVDPFEIQPDMLARRGLRRGEFVAVPEIGIEKRIRNHVLVVAEVGIWNRTRIVVTGEDRSGDGCGQPGRIVECRARERRTARLNLRFALELPRPARELQVFGSRFCDGNDAAPSEDLEFAQDVAIGCCWLSHEHTHKSSFDRFGQLEIGAIERVNGPPVFCVVRDLQRSFDWLANPAQCNAVEAAAYAEIDVDPLFTRASALPGTGEVIGTADMNLLVRATARKLYER